MTQNVEFGCFDRQAETDVTYRDLPHWFQPGVAVFITFRTADSLPKEVILRWLAEQRDWLQRNGWSISDDDELPDPNELPGRLQSPYRQWRDRGWHDLLDGCHGACVLRDPKLAAMVLDSLRHFDGQRYDLDCAVIMPNHVHLLAQFRPPTTCRAQSGSWLHFTATEINRSLGRRGAFWQSEPFDHLVRSPEQFEYLRRYIAENGPRAGLPTTDYLYWRK